MKLIFCLIVFALLFFTNRNRYLNVLYTAVLLLGVTLFVLSKTFLNFTGNDALNYILYTAFTFGFIPFILLALATITFFNSKILLEKEGHRPRNFFISLLGVSSLVVLFIYLYFNLFLEKSTQIEIIVLYIIGLFIYAMLMFSSTAIYAVIYNFAPIFYIPKYIIVLGSGLIDDRVPPLLASRIKKGVQQYKKYGRKPLLILSGGRGSNELISEAAAMKKYAIEVCGLTEYDIISEAKSTTTLENLQFSKKILDDFGITGRGIIVSNNFHVLRAGFYGKQAGLDAVGIGSYTAFYYIPNAFVREFIAIMELHKWWHITAYLSYSLFTIMLSLGYK